MKEIISKVEKVIMLNVLINASDNPTVQSISKEYALIEDLLTIQKSRVLFIPKRTKSGQLRKDPTLKQMLEKRIEIHLNLEQ